MLSDKASRALSLLGLCAVNLVASLDATALSVSLPVISSSLNANAVEAYWAGTSFVLGSAVLQPVFAAFSNAFGRKPVILLALLLFTIGTILCSLAQGMILLLAGRAVQGVGGGGLLTMTYVVIADLYALKDRAKGLAVISMIWLLGTVCGPIVGGAFAAYVTWRWIFWVVLPFIGISVVLIACFLKTSHQTLRPWQAVKHTDWIGAVLLVASLTSLLIAISWAGTMYLWSSWRTYLPLGLGGFGLLCFVLYEARVPSFPIIPLTVLSNPTAASAFLGTLVLGVVQFGLLYYLPLYYQVVKGYNPLLSGLALLPQCLLSGPTTALTGVIIAKTSHYRLIVWLGWILLITGCGLLVLLDEKTSVVQWIFINIVSGFGLGALFTSQSVATQAATEDQHKAIVSGLTPFFRTIGQAFGIVVCGTVFQNTFKARLYEASSQLLREYLDQLVLNSVSMGKILAQLDPASPESIELTYAYNEALHTVWWTLTAFAGIAGVLSLHIQQISLERSEQPTTPAVPGTEIEKASSTEPIVRTMDGNESFFDLQSLRPQASLQTMHSHTCSMHPALLRGQSSFATINPRQLDNMLEEGRRQLAHASSREDRFL